ncbi:glycosyltransferase [Parasediminibacterium paludis]|uniref:Glycosyltransferase n=1 Tax=Parasediminibacterium paludis TaxID=908966 RepID=A0ABV8PZA1_9BACT
MHVLIVNNTIIPALKYGGTERVIWWLGKELVKRGHKVTYMVAKGSNCPFANVLELNTDKPFNELVPADVDMIHLNHAVNETPLKPYIITLHGNLNHQQPLDKNTVFVSANHAARFGSDIFVHNGIDPEDYGKPILNNRRKYIHFLGDAAWRVKNIRGAITIAAKVKFPLHVIGGVRFNFNQGLRLTFDRNVIFHGMKGGAEKNQILNQSKAMLFPVLWHEPFGIAIIESLYFGCPVFGTPYGSLPEIVNDDVGYLSNKASELVIGLQNIDIYGRQDCHDYVMANFTSVQMTTKYLHFYEQVLNGNSLNKTHPQLQKVQVEKFLPFV